MQTATQETFASLIESSLCIVEVSAPWCPDCRKIEPILHKLESSYPQVRFILVDFDSNEALRQQLAIRKIPTLIFYKHGQEVLERIIEPDGALPIEQALQQLLQA